MTNTEQDAATGGALTGGILAIDVGSSRLKLGWFPPQESCTEKPAGQLPIAASKLPEPTESLRLAHGCDLSGEALEILEGWIDEHLSSKPRGYLASVRPPVAETVARVFENHGWSAPRHLSWKDLPLEVRVAEPSRVGIDRLLNAVAANCLRAPEQPSIIVDLGTAGTVDLVAADGTFEGGAIFPGLSLSAKALHMGTASLPELDPATWVDPVPALGKETRAAIAAGLFWGSVGTINELIQRISQSCQTAPQLFVTGGASAQIVKHLRVAGSPARHVPHLILSAIRLVAEKLP